MGNSKITRIDMLTNRKCGLKHYDNAVLLVGHQAVVDKAIDISIEFPDIWICYESPNPWTNFNWSFGNAVSEIIQTKKDISQTYNLKDVLSENDINYIQSKLPRMVGFPPDIWIRK